MLAAARIYGHGHGSGSSHGYGHRSKWYRLMKDFGTDWNYFGMVDCDGLRQLGYRFSMSSTWVLNCLDATIKETRVWRRRPSGRCPLRLPLLLYNNGSGDDVCMYIYIYSKAMFAKAADCRQTSVGSAMQRNVKHASPWMAMKLLFLFGRCVGATRCTQGPRT